MNRPELFNLTWTGAVIVLTAVIEYVMPALTRGDIYFAVTVNPGFRRTAEGASIQRRFRLQIVIQAIAALTLAVAASRFSSLLLPGAVLLFLGGSTVAFFTARSRVIPHAVRPSLQREAGLQPRDINLPGGLLAQALPFGLLLAVAGYLHSKWQQIPVRFPVQWDRLGQPSRWTLRTDAGVYGPLAVAALVLAILILVTFAIKQARTVHVTGPAAPHETRYRRRMLLVLVVIEYIVVLQTSLVALLPLRGTPEHAPDLLLMLAPPLLALALTIGILMRTGQGGSVLSDNMDAIETAPPAGDRTLDEHWKAGLFYVNPEDPAWLVEKRFGIGYTLNFGNRRSWLAIAGLGAFVLLSVLLPKLL